MENKTFASSLELILNDYKNSFNAKVHGDGNTDTDLLMEVFGITHELKNENRQYWGRELGKCWERLLQALFKQTCASFSPAKRYGSDEPADFFVDSYAIDTKYRVGSGDSGTLKKFEQYGALLTSEGYKPLFLFLREDNLPAAISKCLAGGWEIKTGEQTFDFVRSMTGVDLKAWLIQQSIDGLYKISRS